MITPAQNADKLEYIDSSLSPDLRASMPKDFIKKYLPDPDSIRNSKSLGFFGSLLHEPNLWHMNRHSISKAFAIGGFWGCIPIPFQMIAAAFCALRFNANLPVSVSLVWFSNPLTMPPIFYFEYLIGAWILNTPSVPFEFELSLNWLSEKLFEIGIPLYFGSLVCGIILSSAAYLIINTIWRRGITKKWSERRALRLEKPSNQED